MYLYGKTSLNRPIMGPTLRGRFREVVRLGSQNIYMGDRLGSKYSDLYRGVVDL